jgi:phage protein D
VYGQAKNVTNTTPSTDNKPIFTLTYGSTLFSFISIASIQEQDSKTASIARASTAKAPTSNFHCSAECVGIPELMTQVLVSVAGVGNAYDGNYYVKKVTHKLNQSGYATKIVAEIPQKRMLLQPKI